jgi:hypothetical protein
MPESVKDIFNSVYPQLLSDIDGYIVNQKSNPSETLRKHIKRWFYC